MTAALPPGKTCKNCIESKQCVKDFNRRMNSKACVFVPNRFK